MGLLLNVHRELRERCSNLFSIMCCIMLETDERETRLVCTCTPQPYLASPQSTAVQTVQSVQCLVSEWFVLETDEVNKCRVMARTMVRMVTETKVSLVSGSSCCLSLCPPLTACCRNRFYYCVVQPAPSVLLPKWDGSAA